MATFETFWLRLTNTIQQFGVLLDEMKELKLVGHAYWCVEHAQQALMHAKRLIEQRRGLNDFTE